MSEKMSFIPSLNRTYRDDVTGFKGVCVGIGQFLSGTELLLQPLCAEDGKMPDRVWVAIERASEVA